MSTYYELGERLGIEVCTGCAGLNHQAGSWGADGRFHWTERALRRTSLRNFVWRIAAQKGTPLANPPVPAWLRYWRRVEWAKATLRTLRVRLPASAWDNQRATLRALLAVPAGAGFFYDPVTEAREITRKAATRWAKRPVDLADPTD